MISVVVPGYNCEKTIHMCCDSIFAQKAEDYEVILVNDGSGDRTPELCDEIAASHKNVRVLHQKNGGLMNAWKNGVKMAQGEYVVFVDSDDWIEPDLLERIERIVQEEEKPDIIFYGIESDYSDGRVVKSGYRLEGKKYTNEEIKKDILPNYFCTGKRASQIILSSRATKAIKRELLLKNLYLLNEEISVGEDAVTSFAIMQDATSVYNIVDYFPYHYIRYDDSMVGNDAMVGTQGIGTIKKYIKLRSELYKIAEIKGYSYLEQIENYFLDNVLIVLKANAFAEKIGAREKKEYLHMACQMPEVMEVLKKGKKIAKKYSVEYKIIIHFLAKECYGLLIKISDVKNMLRGVRKKYDYC